jgi:predicted short-subunit dehydrogenase-like oxidoreductase (DUF2520 family)
VTLLPAVAIIGPGRVGLTLARALVLSGAPVRVCGRTPRPLPPLLPPLDLDCSEAITSAEVVILAVPDDAVMAVASRLASDGVIGAGHVVLHTSGGLDVTALAPLAGTGAALGSWHPLQTLVAPEGEPEALTGAPAVLEGDPRAVAAARALAERCGMSPIIEVPSDAKVAYHAAAVLAGNSLVVLADLAGRLVAAQGIPGGASLFQPLMARTLANLAGSDPASALTGPVRRGDAGTIAAHLEVLQGDTRELYRLLALEAVRLVEAGGGDAAAVRGVLHGEQRRASGDD